MIVAFDTETHLIGPGQLAPPIVCGIFSARGRDGIETEVLGNAPEDGLEDRIEWMLTSPSVELIVTHSGGYDWAVVCAAYPRLIPLVFDAIFAGRCTDTKEREKLLNLSTTGRLDNLVLPDGSTKRLSYSLAALVLSYLSIDISADKSNDPETSWRLNFAALDGWPAAEYPEDALAYAAQDGELTLLVYEAQEMRKQQWAMASTATEGFQLAKAFVLQLATAWGIETDQEKTDALEAAVNQTLDSTKGPLEEAGILRPEGKLGPPYKKYLPDALALVGVAEPEEIADWSVHEAMLTERIPGIRFRRPRGRPGTRDLGALQEYLAALYRRLGEIPTLTDSGTIKCDAEVQDYLAGKDPVMEQYQERAALTKLVGQIIPVLRSGPVVHPAYDAIKETGRTSSFDGGARKGGERLYPSVNVQQIPRPIRGLDSRGCFKPRAGRVFFDVDVTGLELASVGHVTYTLFGESVHRELYNRGVDLHGYLGAQLAIGTDEGLAREFAQHCRSEGIIGYPMAVYDAFMAFKSSENADLRKFWKHYRNFAKPVGLGFPGGLGPDTMVEFARRTYGVAMTAEQARLFREMWRETYPEMPRFFDWINGQTDPFNSAGGEQLYQYTTGMGLVRRGASFCAAANGMAMQSPGAEAAMTGTMLIARACYDPTQESILYGCRLNAFIHDQVLGETTGETTEDPELWSAQCDEVARLMERGCRMILSSVNVRCDEAHLTAVWSKDSVPQRDENGRHIVWTPAS